jgi:hypothetical protein
MIESFETIKHKAKSEISSSSSSLPWGKSISFFTVLRDVDTGATLSGKAIGFDGTGTGQAKRFYLTTNSSGIASFTANAPSIIGTGWTVQAHFAGNANYLSSDSVVRTFNTVKHETQVSLVVYPSEIVAGKTFTIKIKLNDKATGQALNSKIVSFATSPPILTISNVLTDSYGICTVNGIVVSTVGTYSIQATFGGDAMYQVSSSAHQTLTVK